jgi:hypothetical protein
MVAVWLNFSLSELSAALTMFPHISCLEGWTDKYGPTTITDGWAFMVHSQVGLTITAKEAGSQLVRGLHFQVTAPSLPSDSFVYDWGRQGQQQQATTL